MKPSTQPWRRYNRLWFLVACWCCANALVLTVPIVALLVEYGRIYRGLLLLSVEAFLENIPGPCPRAGIS